MMVKYEGTRLGDRLSVYAGNGQCEDDPRGREITVSFEFGLPTGEFDAPKFLYDQPTRMWGDRPGPRIGTSKDRKSTRLNSSHSQISYAVFCLKKKKKRKI